MFNKITIVGCGLIGSSIAREIKKRKLAKNISVCDISSKTLKDVKSLKLANEISYNLKVCCKDTNIIFICTPLSTYERIFKTIRDHAPISAIITDVGSSKSNIIKLSEKILNKKSSFIPGHPIAGTEKSGPAAAFAELYQEHRVVLTPTKQTDEVAIKKVRNMWKEAGAEVSIMTAEHHDDVLAATSHLPHLLAFNLVDMLAEESGDVAEVLRYAAGGFRDFSRIASSDPEMWRDISLINSTAILSLLKKYQHQMSLLQQAIEQQDADYLIAVFERAKQARDTCFNEQNLKDSSEV